MFRHVSNTTIEFMRVVVPIQVACVPVLTIFLNDMTIILIVERLGGNKTCVERKEQKEQDQCEERR